MREGWYIIEAMGHRRLVGLVSEEEIAGVKLLRIDVPETEGQAAYTTYLGGQAIYALTPTDAETGRGLVAEQGIKPMYPLMAKSVLEAAGYTVTPPPEEQRRLPALDPFSDFEPDKPEEASFP